MDKEQVRKLMEENPTVRALAEEREILWLNSKLASFEKARGGLPLSMADVDDAEARLARFAPFIMKKFPETAEARGIIESELREAAAMKERLCDKYGAKIEGRLFVKMDGDLPIAGSIKARGGIYEVLKHTACCARAIRMKSSRRTRRGNSSRSTRCRSARRATSASASAS